MPKKELEYKPKSCWEIYSSPAQRKAMDETANLYVDFLSQCKTERETVAYVRERLLAAGYQEDFTGDKVFRVIRDKAILIARRGSQPLAQGLRMICAHVDTPRIDLKQHPFYEECGVSQAKTHYYGGIRKYQWLARPLALHGVVVKKDGELVHVCLGEDPSDPVFTIPDLLPHLAYEQVEKTVTKAFEAEKLNIIFGHVPLPSAEEDSKQNDSKKKGKAEKKIKAHVLELLHAKYGIVEEDLFSAELQAVPAGPARFVGLDRGLIGGYGHDDRVCVYAGLKALLASGPAAHTQIMVFWDKEEIGSEGSTGAKSLFLEYCVDDLLAAWEPQTRKSSVLLNTKALSADVHGALDPDFQDLHEKLNAALIGYGPCFCKFTGHRGKVGANDAHPEYVGWLRQLLAKAGAPWQMAELGRVDLGGGGTVAKYLAAYGMDVIDFGPPVLSMHSPFEICSKADLYATIVAFKAFLES